MSKIRVVFEGASESGSQEARLLSEFLDEAFGSIQGIVIFRGAHEWKGLPTGSADGLVLTSGGPNADVYWGPGGSGYLAPGFTSFAISGQTSVVEVGATIGNGDATFTWSTSNSTNVAANSISITDTTASVTLASGLANDGSEVITLGPIVNDSPASQVWTIAGVNTHGTTFTRNFTVSWEWRIYAGTSSNVVLTANQIKALADFSGLESSFPGSYPLADVTGYKYFAFPDSMGDVALFFDSNGGFPWSMAEVADNAAYSNLQATGGSYYYDLISVTNANAVATNYRLYRSRQTFGGTPVFVVT